MTTGYLNTVSTPIGPFSTVSDDSQETVLASGWTADPADLIPLIHATLRPASLKTVKTLPGITESVIAYHQGELNAINWVAVHQVSGPFLMDAWEMLRKVEPGAPITYTEFAALAGRPAAIRGAATACARNAAALFVPCHRVLRLDGSLGGFSWGLPAKQWLLAHESTWSGK